jgi:hypothetical protein
MHTAEIYSERNKSNRRACQFTEKFATTQCSRFHFTPILEEAEDSNERS